MNFNQNDRVFVRSRFQERCTSFDIEKYRCMLLMLPSIERVKPRCKRFEMRISVTHHTVRDKQVTNRQLEMSQHPGSPIFEKERVVSIQGHRHASSACLASITRPSNIPARSDQLPISDRQAQGSVLQSQQNMAPKGRYKQTDKVYMANTFSFQGKKRD